jgi:hypothetical protein
MPTLDYAEVLELLGDGRRSHLLLGNGFSIGCDTIFRYASLYERAVDKGLSQRAQEVFAGLGTNNFEGVMRLLGDSHWVARTYGLVEGAQSDMLHDLEIVKRALVEAIADSHLPHSGSVEDAKKNAAAAFFKPYHNIFTTNYDLLAYWVVMSQEGGPVYRDGFGEDPEEPDAPYVVFSFRLGDQKGLFYLHGGLHLYVNAGHVTKHCWNRSGEPLTTLILQGMTEGKYPLFVAEGTAQKKLQQIYESSYLSYALDKLGRIKNRLVVFGHSLGANDEHLRNAIAGIKDLKELYIGVRDGAITAKADEASAAIHAIRHQRGLTQLDIYYFLSESANVWGT